MEKIKLFSYGTLCMKDVQLREFGQEFYVEPKTDFISGFEIVKQKIDGDFYNVAIPNPDASSLEGYIVHIPQDLMSLVDEYEGSEYKRSNIKTLGGVDCIMYVKK